MGRALVRDPALFLFDEPLSNLDAKLRVEMRTEIKKLYQRLGKTTIYVTHDQVEAMTLASRIAVMHQGSLQQFAEPRTVYDRPANMFVAGFMGSPPMNFLPAQIEVSNPAAVVLMEANRQAAHLPVAAFVGPGRRVVLGIRPENLTRCDRRRTEEKPFLGTIEAPVEVVEPTGAETMVIVRIGSREVIACFEPDAAPSGWRNSDARCRYGQGVSIRSGDGNLDIGRGVESWIGRPGDRPLSSGISANRSKKRGLINTGRLPRTMLRTSIKMATVILQKGHAEIWWVFLLQGLSAVVLGIMLLLEPAATMVALTTLLGFYWLITGMLALVQVFVHRSIHWGLSLITGIVGILAGLFVLRHPLLAALTVPTVFVIVLGVQGLILGVLEIISGFRGGGFGSMFLGAINLIVGLFLLSSPVAAALAVPVVFGVLLLIQGIAVTIWAFRIRSTGSSAQRVASET
jgi:uncharacterized membrane protein HdeD (DUF308 family)